MPWLIGLKTTFFVTLEGAHIRGIRAAVSESNTLGITPAATGGGFGAATNIGTGTGVIDFAEVDSRVRAHSRSIGKRNGNHVVIVAPVGSRPRAHRRSWRRHGNLFDVTLFGKVGATIAKGLTDRVTPAATLRRFEKSTLVGTGTIGGEVLKGAQVGTAGLASARVAPVACAGSHDRKGKEEEREELHGKHVFNDLLGGIDFGCRNANSDFVGVRSNLQRNWCSWFLYSTSGCSRRVK